MGKKWLLSLHQTEGALGLSSRSLSVCLSDVIPWSRTYSGTVTGKVAWLLIWLTGESWQGLRFRQRRASRVHKAEQGDLIVPYFLGLNCCFPQGIQTCSLEESLSKEPQTQVWLAKRGWRQCRSWALHCCPHGQGWVWATLMQGAGCHWYLTTNPAGTLESCQELIKNKLQGPTWKHSDSVGVKGSSGIFVWLAPKCGWGWTCEAGSLFQGAGDENSAPRGAEPSLGSSPGEARVGGGRGYTHQVCPGAGRECRGQDGRRWGRARASGLGQKRSKGASESPAVTHLSPLWGSHHPHLGTDPVLEWSINCLLPLPA